MPLDDPTELFDVCDPDGRPLGRTKARAAVHRDGDWHRSVHLWVVLASGDKPKVLFQRRSLTKDSHPGKVDVSVAGHRRAGEVGGATAATIREAKEEAGLVLRATELVRLGSRWHVHVASLSHVDREVQDVFFTITPRGLETMSPDADEVRGLIEVRLDAAVELATDVVVSVSARELRPGGVEARNITLCADELVPSSGYFGHALRTIQRRLRGVMDPEWTLKEPGAGELPLARSRPREDL